MLPSRTRRHPALLPTGQAAAGTLRRARPAGEVETALRRLELLVTRRLDGMLTGAYSGLLPGPGTERAENREYLPGDDVRRMDWAVTARTTVPHVSDPIADRELETWLVVDLSPSTGVRHHPLREARFGAGCCGDDRVPHRPYRKPDRCGC